MSLKKETHINHKCIIKNEDEEKRSSRDKNAFFLDDHRDDYDDEEEEMQLKKNKRNCTSAWKNVPTFFTFIRLRPTARKFIVRTHSWSGWKMKVKDKKAGM